LEEALLSGDDLFAAAQETYFGKIVHLGQASRAGDDDDRQMLQWWGWVMTSMVEDTCYLITGHVMGCMHEKGAVRAKRVAGLTIRLLTDKL